MKFTLATISLFASALAAPQPAHFNKLKRAPGAVKENSYIVVLKENASRQASIQGLNDLVFAADDTESIREVTYDNWSVLHGYSAILGGAALEHVLSDPNVDYVEEDGVFTIDWSPELEVRAAEPAPVVEAPRLVTRQAGAGTIFYGIDTGIRITHTSFGGRATWGATFGGYASQDGNGHGTHTAGTAAGTGFGPATSASIVAVKVLSDGGSGAWSDVISGVDWATQHFLASGQAGVANLSLGGSTTPSVDTAVANAVAAGLHVTVAAGNSNANANTFSPARVATAVTVGAITSANVKASFSNWGPVLDVWYLGVSVVSAYSTSDTATASLSGTSMAAPGVAGLLLVAISAYGNKSPADLAADLIANAKPDVNTSGTSGSTNLRAVQW